MTMIINDEDKPSLEEIIAHSGVKGMHWGVRKKRVTASEIHDARLRQNTRLNKFMDEKGRSTDPTASAKSRAAAAGKAKKAERDFDTSEDRVTAVRITRGEKAVLLMLTGPVGAAVIVGNKIGVRSVAKATDKARQKA